MKIHCIPDPYVNLHNSKHTTLSGKICLGLTSSQGEHLMEAEAPTQTSLPCQSTSNMLEIGKSLSHNKNIFC